MRSELRARLEARRGEIEQALLTRTHAIASPSEVADHAYAASLRAAVSAALDYGLDTLDVGDAGEPEVPLELLAHARLAARSGVSLDTALRRYFAGYNLFGFFVLEEAGSVGLLDGVELRRLTVTQVGRFDRLLAAIGAEHQREQETRQSTPNRRKLERIERLLAAEPLDTSEIAYDFGSWHVGVMASGRDAERKTVELATVLDCRRLTVRRDERVVWTWLGTRRRPDPGTLLDAFSRRPDGVSLSIGEPAKGLAGWRLTHRQAAVALSLAERGDHPVLRYRDVALLATVARDELLVTSLRQLYLEPLAAERDGGDILRKTLRAYLDADRNVSSAAAALSVTRKTVKARLRTVERLVGRSLMTCSSEIDLVLRLYEMHTPSSPDCAISSRSSTRIDQAEDILEM